MKDYTAPCDHVFTPAEQCILYAYCRYYERIQNLETPSNESVEAVVARWLSAPNPNLGPMTDYLEAHEDLRLKDVVYSLGDFKDFDEWINHVEALEQRNDPDSDQRNGCGTSPQVHDEAANFEPVSGWEVEAQDVDGGWDVVVVEGMCNKNIDTKWWNEWSLLAALFLGGAAIGCTSYPDPLHVPAQLVRALYALVVILFFQPLWTNQY
ncbi:hypothetical protein BDR22DRAFT_823723 [Usnea florida]